MIPWARSACYSLGMLDRSPLADRDASADGLKHPALGGAKRMFDVIVGLLLLVAALPFLVLIGLFILLTMGRPIFFLQERPGLNGRPFRLIKFRSMSVRHGANGQLLPDDERLENAGHFLRSTSLDELPELINVVRGDLSLVGPRPLLMEYLSLYSATQFRRHEVRPGLTGLAQINGRNALKWEDKFALDVHYVDHWSMALDVRILAVTAWRVLTRHGIRQEGHATTPKFEGNPIDP